MKLNQIVRTVLSIILITLIVLVSAQSIVYANTQEQTDLYLKHQNIRMIKTYNGDEVNFTDGNGAYKIGDGENTIAYQIIEMKDSNYNTKEGIDLYCVNAGKPLSNGGDHYTAHYNMKTQKNDITTKGIINSDNYSAVVWLLDNLYVQEKNADKAGYLANAGIIFDNDPEINTYVYDRHLDTIFNNKNLADIGRNFGYKYIDTSDNKIDVLLPDELIEVVQQAAIWYFTNNSDFNYLLTYSDDGLNNGFIYYSPSGATNSFIGLNEYTVNGKNGQVQIGNMYLEQASILYDYLVREALKANTAGYTGTSQNAQLTIEGLDNVEKQNDGTYKVGPIKVKSDSAVTDLQIDSIQNGENDITSSVTVEPSTITLNGDFYLTIPENITGDITLNVSAKQTAKTQTLWIENENNNSKQPVVKIAEGKTPVEKSGTINITEPEEVFDLALRKTITGVKTATGSTVEIKNENGLDATRTITADISTIPNTATYKHRKDPVVVSKGNIVTYKLSIYNEGDIDGYPSKIVDQLPTGLKTTLKVNDTVTSDKGNTYTVTSISDNKIELTIKDGTTITSIGKFDGTTLNSDSIDLEAEVTQNEDKNKHYLTNIAYIAQAKDSTNTEVVQDRQNTESKPSEYPNKTADELNGTTPTYKGGSDKDIYSDTNNTIYFPGEQDDDDFETVVLTPKEFDLKLVKYISAINGDTTKGKTITGIDTTKLNTINSVTGNKVTTANYELNKDPIVVKTGDYVTYTIRIFNEGEIAGYATKITEDIPTGLEFVYPIGISINEGTIDYSGVTAELSDEDKAAIEFNMLQGWSQQGENLVVSDKLKDTLLSAFDSSKTTDEEHNIVNGLNYADVQIMLKVTSTDTKNIIRNEAAITEDKDENKEDITDRDSKPEDWKKYEDDEDYDNIRLLKFDLALRKFISAISTDIKIDEADYLKDAASREPKVDTSKLKAGTETTATYNHSKQPIELYAGDYVLYTIRVYNEGDQDGYAAKVTDYLPTYLDYIDGEFNTGFGWQKDTDNAKKITSNYLSSTDKKIKAFDALNDDGNGSKLDYKDIQILCRVNENAIVGQNITNIAEITEYQDANKVIINPDADSTYDNLVYPTDVPGYKDNETGAYIPGQQDDDDFEKVKVRNLEFDLALRKFITKINEEDVTTRIPQVKFEDNKITYEHPKDVVKVNVGDLVTYTIRVYNEGKIDGFAQTITDDIPEYLEFLPEYDLNKTYRWKMYDEEGNETEDVTKAKKIVSDYTSKEYGEELKALWVQGGSDENPNYLTAFDKTKEIDGTNPDFTEVQVAFKVKDPNSSKTIIVNKAQISEDCDKDGNPVTDVDSIPNEWNDGEDDQDFENVAVEYFDLSLLKYVSEVIVKENGTTTTTKTKNNGGPNDIIPKVEIHRKKFKSTSVKFVYTIKVTNEGDIPGYAKELTDYVPKGLEFYAEDNKGWEQTKKGVIKTTLLEDTLLNPGESATVKVTFRWKKSSSNLGLKTNTAEISKDENERGIPDRDSIPGNKIPGEDDIDTADVLLSIKTGLTENIIAIVGGTLVILSVLAGGIILIKKYVL